MATISGGERYAIIDDTAEATVGEVNAVPTWKGVRLVGSGSNALNPGKQTLDITEEANVSSQPAPIFSHFAPAGPLQTIPSPYDSTTTFGSQGWLRFALDWFFKRTGGLLNSHTIELIDPDILTRQFVGCKPNGLTIGYTAADGLITFGLDILGLHVGRRSSARSDATTESVTFPSSRHWVVANIIAQLGDELTASNDEVTPQATVTALQITGSNNMVAGAVRRYFPTNGSPQETERRGLSELREGDLRIEGSLELLLEDATHFDRMVEESGQRGSVRLLAYHPDSTKTLSNATAGFSTTPPSDLGIVVDAITGFAAGDAAFLEQNSGAFSTWKNEVLQVKTAIASTITVITDGDQDTNDESYGRSQSFADNSSLWSKGLSLRLPNLQIQNVEPTGGEGDKVGRRITFVAEVGDAESTYSPSPGAGWDAYPMKWLVR